MHKFSKFFMKFAIFHETNKKFLANGVSKSFQKSEFLPLICFFIDISLYDFFTELFNIEAKRVVFARPLSDYRGEHRIASQIDTRSWLPPFSHLGKCLKQSRVSPCTTTRPRPLRGGLLKHCS